MAKVKGVWRFNDEIVHPSDTAYTVQADCNFSYEGDTIIFDRMHFYYNDKSTSMVRGWIIVYSKKYNETTYIPSLIYDTNSGWQKEEQKTIDFGATEQEVPDEFYSWFSENAHPIFATITYNGKSTELTEGQTATLHCAGKKAVADIVAAFDSYGKITYDGIETEVDGGKTATLACAGKKMLADVIISMAAAPAS